MDRIQEGITRLMKSSGNRALTKREYVRAIIGNDPMGALEDSTPTTVLFAAFELLMALEHYDSGRGDLTAIDVANFYYPADDAFLPELLEGLKR